MNDSTAGIELRPTRSRTLRDAVELVSSMRFAISLLTLICIAAIIGTVVRQQEPLNNYVNQFGPFWAEVFGGAGLYTVYSAWWFLLILGVLVLSTSLCIARNAPKIFADLRSFKEHVREQSLQAFHHKARGVLAEAPDAALARTTALMQRAGWSVKTQSRPNGQMVAARKGMANKLGYLFAHSSIVLICLGGAADGDLVVRLQMLLQGKAPYSGTGLIRDVPAQHWLSESNPTFRGNLPVSEGARASIARLNMPDGIVLQPLPFDIELKKFIVEYYETGMPKLFASEIVIHDHAGEPPRSATVKVNEPVFHRGVAIYQSSFEDGGSAVTLRALPLGSGRPFELKGKIGGSTELAGGNGEGDPLTLEYGALRVINVENMGDGSTGATDVRKVDLAGSFEKHLGSGAKGPDKGLRNVGPSVGYLLRDAAGQAREFHNYMLPIELDGQRVLLAGVRENPNEAFRYLRIPVDEKDGVDGWLLMRQGLADTGLRAEAVKRYVALATPTDKPEMAAQLTATAQRALSLFAGAEAITGTDGQALAGLHALSRFLETQVPEPERERISGVLLRILSGTLFELANVARERAGMAVLQPGEPARLFMTQALVSLSDSFAYPAPLLLQLTDFTQVQASVFQVARAPGKTLVYLGAVLLILGVFAMLYIRERRLWIWLEPSSDGGTRISTALSTTRRTLDADAEFEQLKAALLEPSR